MSLRGATATAYMWAHIWKTLHLPSTFSLLIFPIGTQLQAILRRISVQLRTREGSWEKGNSCCTAPAHCSLQGRQFTHSPSLLFQFGCCHSVTWGALTTRALLSNPALEQLPDVQAAIPSSLLSTIYSKYTSIHINRQIFTKQRLSNTPTWHTETWRNALQHLVEQRKKSWFSKISV